MSKVHLFCSLSIFLPILDVSYFTELMMILPDFLLKFDHFFLFLKLAIFKLRMVFFGLRVLIEPFAEILNWKIRLLFIDFRETLNKYVGD